MKLFFYALATLFSFSIATAQVTNIDELTENHQDIILKIKKNRIAKKYTARINIDKNLDAQGERYYYDNRLKESESRKVVYFESMDDLKTFFSRHGYHYNANKYAYWDHPSGEKNKYELRNGTAKIGTSELERAENQELREVVVYSKSGGYVSSSTCELDDKCICPSTCEGGCCGCTKCNDVEMAFESVYFDTDKSEVKSGEIAKLVKALKADKNLKLRIEGNADLRGDVAYNKALAERRAKECKRMLVEDYGFDAKRFNIVSNGEVKPQSETLSKNRRVDFFVIK
ncbi:MAG: OmpA family protein [Flavobacteriales bacterium]